MMISNIIIIILNFVVLVELSKENVEDVSASKKELWIDVQKRLNIGSKHDQYGCRTLNLNNTIIMAHASLNNGASYIPTPAVNSAQECASACCDVQECNVAVYKLKGNSGLCYLFNCGIDAKLCNFTRLEGYVSMKLDDHSKDLKSQSEANDIESQLPHVTSRISVNNATSSRQPIVDSTAMPSPSDKSLQVPLFGSCNSNSDCAIMASECVVTFCLCRKGYHAQNGHCRRDCTRFEFECVNEGRPLADPQCIAVYDACDGIAHCADESDERSCPASSANREPPSSLHAKEAEVVEKNAGNKKLLNDQAGSNAPEIDHSSSDHMIDLSKDFPEYVKQDHHKTSAPFTDMDHNYLMQNENSASADTDRHSDQTKQGVGYNENKQVQSPSAESHSRQSVHQGDSKIKQSGHSEGHKLSREQLMENENHREMDKSYMGEQGSFRNSNRQHPGREKSWPQWNDARSYNEEEQDLSQEKQTSPDYIDYYQPGYDNQRNDGVPYRFPSRNHRPSFKDNRNYQSHQQLPSQATDEQQSAQYATHDNKIDAKVHTNEKTNDKSSGHTKGEKITTEASVKPTIATSVTQSSSSSVHESITAYHSSKTELQEASLLEVAEIDEGAKSAMIILILGLLLTFIMLVLIGCRLRTMKMRLRRGATLNSQEADYLINGMYL